MFSCGEASQFLDIKPVSVSISCQISPFMTVIYYNIRYSCEVCCLASFSLSVVTHMNTNTYAYTYMTCYIFLPPLPLTQTSSCSGYIISEGTLFRLLRTFRALLSQKHACSALRTVTKKVYSTQASGSIGGLIYYTTHWSTMFPTIDTKGENFMLLSGNVRVMQLQK